MMDNSSARDAIRSYSGFLQTNETPESVRKKIEDLASASGLKIEVLRNSIEFEFTGRDSNRFVVEFLRQLAAELGNASGEVVCESSGDVGEIEFEFYSISDGRLYVQRGKIVREPIVPV